MHHPVDRATVRRLRPFLLAAVVAMEAAGCGSSHQLLNMWKDPAYPRAPMSNVLVIAMKKDDAIRRLWEDQFVQSLQKQGVSAVPSYRLFEKTYPDTQQVARAVREHSFDGVIVTRRLPDQTKTEYVPGYVHSEPVSTYNPWINAFYTDYVDIWEPGYTETSQVVRHRTDVWSTRDQGRMVWTGTSEVIDPTSSDQVSRYIAGMVVPELAKKQVIPGSK